MYTYKTLAALIASVGLAAFSTLTASSDGTQPSVAQQIAQVRGNPDVAAVSVSLGWGGGYRGYYGDGYYYPGYYYSYPYYYDYGYDYSPYYYDYYNPGYYYYTPYYYRGGWGHGWRGSWGGSGWHHGGGWRHH